MKVGVFNALLELAGGSEKFALELCRALNELGHDAELITFCSDWDALQRSLSLLAPEYKPKLTAKPTPPTYNVLDSVLAGRFLRLKRLILASHLLKGLQNSDYDILIDTSSNIPLDVDISYIHYPAGTGGGVIYAFYHVLVKFLSKFLEGDPRLVLTNSSWTAEKVVALYPRLSGRVYVLHPPVDVEYFNEGLAYGRERLVVTISRFTPEKNLDKVLDVAKELKEYEFVLVGSTAKYSEPVIKSLKNRIDGEGLGNVNIMVNLPRDELRKLLSRAKYYLHPQFAEHFGISVIEAMAAGCVPIVYRDGGAWYDVVSKVSDVLGYNDVAEVPNIIKRIDCGGDLYSALRDKSVEYSKKFNYEGFKKNLSNWVNCILRIKK